MCRSRRELSDEHFVAKIGFGTAENEPCEVCRLSVYISIFAIVARCAARSNQEWRGGLIAAASKVPTGVSAGTAEEVVRLDLLLETRLHVYSIDVCPFPFLCDACCAGFSDVSFGKCNHLHVKLRLITAFFLTVRFHISESFHYVSHLRRCIRTSAHLQSNCF